MVGNKSVEIEVTIETFIPFVITGASLGTETAMTVSWEERTRARARIKKKESLNIMIIDEIIEYSSCVGLDPAFKG